ncbi:hypothetical protein HNY73_016574 [Argiope bruennichi]|uniref:Uncharacterized protein n=1 Tax=Argiope bruennichi TaxID=94029 RepID=A0A8T0EP61_ARGBR|nr:hypothetical protein HNY73_016574 [Argiope bruennichi]
MELEPEATLRDFSHITPQKRVKVCVQRFLSQFRLIHPSQHATLLLFLVVCAFLGRTRANISFKLIAARGFEL